VNKKKQKNFNNFSSGLFQHRAKRSNKVFWFFFSKKNVLIYFLLHFWSLAGQSSSSEMVPSQSRRRKHWFGDETRLDSSS